MEPHRSAAGPEDGLPSGVEAFEARLQAIGVLETAHVQPLAKAALQLHQHAQEVRGDSTLEYGTRPRRHPQRPQRRPPPR